MEDGVIAADEAVVEVVVVVEVVLLLVALAEAVVPPLVEIGVFADCRTEKLY